MSELADLRKARGRWCFVKGHRWLRVERIRFLEEQKAAKPKRKKKKPATIEGSDEANDAETTTDEA